MSAESVRESDKNRSWKFARTGGVNQVLLRNGADIANLHKLDLKLWMALAMPTRGLEFDPRTADLLDTDGNGRIWPTEIIAAIQWAGSVFNSLDDLMKGGDSVKLSAIKDEAILANARRVLANLGKSEAIEISMADIAAQEKLFANARFTGEGLVNIDAAGDTNVRKAMQDIISAVGGVADRNGKPGINRVNLEGFVNQAGVFVAWNEKAEKDMRIVPLGPEQTAEAYSAFMAIKTKADDYFVRCRLAAFDSRTQSALNCDPDVFVKIAGNKLTLGSAEIADLPLAVIEPEKPLPLDKGINPAWAETLSTFVSKTLAPLLGAGRKMLPESDWTLLQATLAPYSAWLSDKPATVVESLGLPRLRELLSGNAHSAIDELLDQDVAYKKENACLEALEKVIRFQRDLYELITNYVNFSDFYGRTLAVFQAGILYLDARACHLCIEVLDPAKHSGLAGLSGAFLAYCDISKTGVQKKNIVAVFTDGDSDNLMVGRNGVFYDRQGQAWDATIIKIVSNPISVREAFWMPYKKLARLIESQIAKHAQAEEAAASSNIAGAALAAVPGVGKPAPVAPKKIDLGTIALIGTAIGGISALIGGLLQAIFGLGMWLPLGLVGIVLLISGPSMLMAWLKLRQRNLSPILDANGWAINTRAMLNVSFGAALTELAVLPPNSELSLVDPYAGKRYPWKTLVVVVIITILAYCWWIGRLDAYLPDVARKHAPITNSTESASQAPVAN